MPVNCSLNPCVYGRCTALNVCTCLAGSGWVCSFRFFFPDDKRWGLAAMYVIVPCGADRSARKALLRLPMLSYFSAICSSCVRGECVAPNVCKCAPGFTGVSCNVCVSGYSGSNCDQCWNLYFWHSLNSFSYMLERLRPWLLLSSQYMHL
jgi:hypothetical protein